MFPRTRRTRLDSSRTSGTTARAGHTNLPAASGVIPLEHCDPFFTLSLFCTLSAGPLPSSSLLQAFTVLPRSALLKASCRDAQGSACGTNCKAGHHIPLCSQVGPCKPWAAGPAGQFQGLSQPDGAPLSSISSDFFRAPLQGSWSKRPLGPWFKAPGSFSAIPQAAVCCRRRVLELQDQLLQYSVVLLSPVAVHQRRVKLGVFFPGVRRSKSSSSAKPGHDSFVLICHPEGKGPGPR